MTPPIPIETDPLLFDKLLEPLEATLHQLDQEPLSQAAGKLKFRLFVRILFFRLFARIESARDLVTEPGRLPLSGSVMIGRRPSTNGKSCVLCFRLA